MVHRKYLPVKRVTTPRRPRSPSRKSQLLRSPSDARELERSNPKCPLGFLERSSDGGSHEKRVEEVLWVLGVTIPQNPKNPKLNYLMYKSVRHF